ncbi:MAG: hypothetical protein JNN08_01655 [Bryobacterales bacterium]|nr:hypothetical protein [Bryobacterales bacterium]
MKILVLAGDGTEPGLGAIRFFLQSMGVPFEAVITKSQGLPALVSNGVGRYQGVIQTTGNLAYLDGGAWKSGLTPDQWTTLDTYTRDYKVRVVSYYTWPEPKYGIEATGGATGNPSKITFTAASAPIFFYLNRSNAVDVQYSWTYFARVGTLAAGETTTPLLMMGTNVVAALHTKPDGREYIALTVDNNQYLKHSAILNYGLLKWVTKGIFLGFRKTYLSTQSDDLFLPNDLFVLSKPECHPVGQAAQDPTYDPTLKGCPEYRITGAELTRLNQWQAGWRGKALTRDFEVSIAFNGYGTTADFGVDPAKDSLASAARQLRNAFIWINHTYDHENLDCYDAAPLSGVCVPATKAQSLFEISENKKVSQALGLKLDAASMVTPNISGLANPAFLAAAKESGIKYLVSDTSRNDYLPQIPNEGVRSPFESSILYIPRRATSLFYNTTSGRTGVAGSLPDEYNLFYGPNGIFKLNGLPWFNTTQTYDQIIDRESEFLLNYMLRYEVYPTMYHQSNFALYQNGRSLFSDLIDQTLTKYGRAMNIPVLSLNQTEMGQWIEERMAYNRAQITATLYPNSQIVIRSNTAVKVPITGVCKTGCETYGTERISYVNTTAGGLTSVTLP